MLPKFNPKQLEKAMHQLGVKQQPINAKEVIIKLEDKDIVIKNPNVVKVNFSGHESFEVSGHVIERTGINEDDIKTVMEQANVSKEKALDSLKRNNGDLAAAILDLKDN